MQPVTVWITPSGPNPWKVVHVAEELRIPYELRVIQFEETKLKPFIDINPNGRVPAIVDPNTGITIWESGAIILYFIEQYDKQHTLTHDSIQERSAQNQWLFFQVSGQGPYYGQLGWFAIFHHERLPSAVERYTNEMHRVLGVLETALQGKEWLVGDKMTYADLSFAWWNEVVKYAISSPDKSPLEAYPSVWAWHQRMTARDSFKKLFDMRNKLMEASNIVPSNGLPPGVTVQDLLAKAKEMSDKGETGEGTTHA